MADLIDDQKREIVEALACYRDVPSIIAAFHREHGIQLDRKQVGRYDPTRPYYAAGDKWRAIFDARRKAFMDDVSAVPVAHQTYRLNMLQRGVEAAEKAGNWPLVASLLEQAAKEMGGVYTSRRTLQISDTAPKSARDLTPEERREKVADIIRQAMEQAKLRAPAVN